MLLRLAGAVALTLWLALPASAEVAVLDRCLAGIDPQADDARQQAEACIGTIANPCQDAPGGSSTMGMFACLEQEHDAWDSLLNRHWKPLLAEARRHDATEREIGSDAPSEAEALRAAQRAWIAWRDAECAWTAAQWGSGTGRGPAFAACLMQLTAERAITFHLTLAWRP